ncbi:hypothetical protein GCM10009616_38850 [Microlunatus lacustris]
MTATVQGAATSFALVRAELAEAGLTLVRAWPRSPEHLLLDVGSDGRRVAGQWCADPADAVRTARRTPGARSCGRVVLQPDGADRRLPGLAALVAEPGSRLVGHRPGRRAVVEVADGGGRHFVKVVPPPKQPALLAAARRAAALPLRTPVVRSADGAIGTVATEALTGTPLTDWLGGADADAALTAVGTALSRLHALTPPAGLAEHDAAAERAVTARWAGFADAFGLHHGPEDEPAAPPRPLRRVLVHRDVHDGQLLLAPGPDGPEPGVLDFDLMALGDPALDLANLVAHLELRARQGVLADPAAATAVLLAAYRPDAAVRAALPCYLALARHRLRCVYGFRSADLVT